MIKRILIVGAILSSAISFSNRSSDIIEDRIENILEYKYRILDDGVNKLKVKSYDVDVYQNYVNVEVEIGNRGKNFDFDKAFVLILEEINKETNNATDINIVVELDKVMGDDEIVYNKRFQN